MSSLNAIVMKSPDKLEYRDHKYCLGVSIDVAGNASVGLITRAELSVKTFNFELGWACF